MNIIMYKLLFIFAPLNDYLMLAFDLYIIEYNIMLKTMSNIYLLIGTNALNYCADRNKLSCIM